MSQQSSNEVEVYSAKDFYNSFQLNYFDYKQATYDYILSKSDSEIDKFAGSMVDHKIEHYKRSIYMEIRQTYLLSLDTLFEVIYALLPNKISKKHKPVAILMDDKIVSQLNRRTAYLGEFEKYLKKKPNNFNRLRWKVTYSHGEKKYDCSVLQYIFYDGLFDTEHDKEIQESVPALWEAIESLGKEVLETRDELNSYKHGLRVIPFLQEFSVSKSREKIEQIKIDTSNSVSFQTVSKDRKIRTVHTRTFDYKRDIAMTNYVSLLLHNIIALRKRRYISNGKANTTVVFILGPNGLKNSSKATRENIYFKLNLPNKDFFDPQ